MGGSGIFTRGWGDFQKLFGNFVDFFHVHQLDFPSSPRAQKILFGQNLCAAGKFFKKRANNSNFLGKFDQKIAFFSLRAFRLKTNTIGAEGALEKF